MKSLYLLFAVTIFLSSFLLFQVQPLIGKHVLPWYGGSSAVWVTAMFFFMVALAVGYVYALFLSKLRPLYQGAIHILVTVSTLVLLYKHAAIWPSAITPSAGDISISFSEPVLAVFATLLITIGLPFALLSSSSSLLQLWYAALSGREPFSLYGISNIGSLLGLLSYPILFEPFLTTYTQGGAWAYGFILYVVLLVVIIYLFLNKHPHKEDNIFIEKLAVVAEVGQSPTRKDFLVWLGIASVPVMVMLAGTSFMTTSIAPVPFLWVGPLALYLVSFIFTFRNGDRPPVWANEIFVVTTAIITLILVIMSEAHASIFVTIFITHLALFAISHWCHEYLYNLRPQAKYLTLFYVALSLGGILGSLIIKVSNSYLLKMPIELMIILVVSTIVVGYHWSQEKDFYLPSISRIKLRLLVSLIILVMVSGSALYIFIKKHNAVVQERNFFGYKAVIEKERDGTKTWSMQHGLTNHGFQVFENGTAVVMPVSYYGKSSGIGKAFAYIHSDTEKNPRVIVAGLGSGGLAAYCKEGDDFTFIEIDEEVVSLAREYFTYLKSCPQHKMIVSDARLILEEKARAGKEKYDLIVLDAYADDMMPVHLMTTEAITTYKSLLSPEGILAIHISSRYLNLLPVLRALSEDNGMAARQWFDKTPQEPFTFPSQWVLLASKENVFLREEFSVMGVIPNEQKPLLWTDTYSALLPIINF